MSAKNEKIDRDALHFYLFHKANSRGLVTLHMGPLADDLGIRNDHLGRILNEMAGAGRISKVRRGPSGVVYSVRDPEEWATETGYRFRRRRN